MQIGPLLRSALAGAVLLPLAACNDEIPTRVGDGALPLDQRPATFEVVIGTGALVSNVGRFQGYTDASDASFLLVANDFGGSLQAHSLLRFTGAPAADSVAGYQAATLTVAVDTLFSVGSGVGLRLFALTQAWDPEFASWTRATDTTVWIEPGGTTGDLLAVAAAHPTAADSVVFALDSVATRRIAAADFPGFLIDAQGAPRRVRISNAALRTQVRLQANPDSTVTRTFTPEAFRFVFTPDQPFPAQAWIAGGPASARTLFRLEIPDRLPTCANPQQADCGTIPLSKATIGSGSLTINSASLLLNPVAVPGGFGPVGPTPVALRSVVERELGRQAPLGPVVQDRVATAQGTFFSEVAVSPTDTVVAVPVTQLVRSLAASDSTGVSLALLGGRANALGLAEFGATWFDPSPKLRIIYTVSSRSALP